MKSKSTFVILLTCMSVMANCFGQIPNQGFENWTNAGAYWSPDGWWTTNDSAAAAYYPVTRSTDHYPLSIGNYSMRLENNLSVLPDWGAMGLAWTGGWSGNNYPAFPITGHPNSLSGYYQFMPQNNDTFEIHIRLYKNGVDVSGGQFKSAAVTNTWTSFIMPFTGYADADSARIMILACYDNDAPVPHGNSVLYIDNLNFDSLINDGIPDPGEKQIISIYPNPANGILNIVLTRNKETQRTIEIENAFGQLVFEKTITGYESIAVLDVTGLDAGIYFIRITGTGGSHDFGKFIISR